MLLLLCMQQANLYDLALSVQAVQGEPLPPLHEGEILPITEVELKQVRPQSLIKSLPKSQL